MKVGLNRLLYATVILLHIVQCRNMRLGVTGRDVLGRTYEKKYALVRMASPQSAVEGQGLFGPATNVQQDQIKEAGHPCQLRFLNAIYSMNLDALVSQ